MKILFSKVTVDRKIEYQIETRIAESGNSLWTMKRGIRSQDHVHSIIDKSIMLKSVYGDMVDVPVEKNGFVVVPYRNGKSLLDIAVKDSDAAISRYLGILETESNLTDFSMTEEFRKIFGEKNFQCKATTISDFDLTLSNILVEGDIIHILDNEWVFPFPVPVDFIKFRAIQDMLNNGVKEEYSSLASKMQIQLNLEELQEMDASFSSMVHGTSYKKLLRKNELYVLNAISNDQKERDRLNQLNEEKDAFISGQDKEIQKLSGTVSRQTDEIMERNAHIQKLDQEIEGHRENEKKHSEELGIYREQVRSLEEERLKTQEELRHSVELSSMHEELSKEYTAQTAELNRKNNELNNKCAELEKTSAELAQANAELTQIKGSTTYRLSLKWFKVRDFFFPPNSKRKLILKVMLKGLRHPIWFLKHLTPSNIKKFKKYERSEGADRVLERINVYQENNTELSFKKKLVLHEMNPREEYPVLTLPEPSLNPLVSIIIPVYNQFSYTYGCIEAIIENTKGIDYEVILADDCSTDETKDITKYVANIIVSRNEKNTRFLLNCKQAAKKARGKYVFFLNNDTNVQPNWLSSLLETIESDGKIGMVGSKLVYPTGALQEAGGILWRDGSAWNYGNKSDPEASEYNYRKPVDYISGAAIMLSKELWDSLGGFDETFCPAYCEDSDLAFSVRKAGYEVMYDPFSVVVHYEGVSNGTDVKHGVKKYQVENSEKFYEKWKDTLALHYPNAENVFTARERSYSKKNILMIDHYVPQYDKDAGSRTVFNYLKLMVQLGYNVKFMGENFYRHEPYTKELQKMGIEVLYGNYYGANYKTWLKENGKYFDIVFFNRPHITKKFIDDVEASCTHAKFIYYGHDLHYMRVYREYEITKNPKTLAESNDWKKTEYDIFNKVDLIYYPSKAEEDTVKKENPKLNVKVLQPYFYENVRAFDFRPEERKDIMFVGGFRHGPNYDGIKWFLDECYPGILRENPDMVLHIVGQYPPEDIVKRASANIIVHGFVSDEELSSLYKKVRLIVVPLRFGAGIKGKVIEAMAMGVPVITTSCGAEGIETDAIYVDEELKSVNMLYEDYSWLEEHSKMSIEYIQKNYSMESAEVLLKNDLSQLLK